MDSRSYDSEHRFGAWPQFKVVNPLCPNVVVSLIARESSFIADNSRCDIQQLTLRCRINIIPPVNVKAVFLFLVLLAVLGFDVYFWAFHWTPTRRALHDLMEENARLVGVVDPGSGETSEIQGKPKDAFDSVEEPSLPEEVEDLLEKDEAQSSEKDRYTYKATDLFSGKETHLTTAGKTLLSNIALDLRSRSYSRVIARVYPDSDYSRSKPFGVAQTRSMAIIKYLTQKGISGKKLLAVPINTRYKGGKVVILVEK